MKTKNQLMLTRTFQTMIRLSLLKKCVIKKLLQE